MRNSDEQIDLVLNGLRDMETPEGMERRILRTVQEQAASHTQVRWNKGPWAWIGAFASVAAVCVMALMLHRERPALTVARLPSRALAVTPQIDVARPIFSPAPVVRGKPGTRHDSKVLKTGEASAIELQAVSFPAPPMPLTEQEKLLLRVVHKGDPVQMAMLDPVQRLARDARGKAEFQQFFEPLTTGETK